jgi:hypothetical protein
MKLTQRRSFALALLLVASPQVASAARNYANAVLNDVNNLYDYKESATDQVGVSVDYTHPIFPISYHAGARVSSSPGRYTDS